MTTGAGNPGKYVLDVERGRHPYLPCGGQRRFWPSALRAWISMASSLRATESGGHVGEATTMALVPAVV